MTRPPTVARSRSMSIVIFDPFIPRSSRVVIAYDPSAKPNASSSHRRRTVSSTADTAPRLRSRRSESPARQTTSPGTSSRRAPPRASSSTSPARTTTSASHQSASTNGKTSPGETTTVRRSKSCAGGRSGNLPSATRSSGTVVRLEPETRRRERVASSEREDLYRCDPEHEGQRAARLRRGVRAAGLPEGVLRHLEPPRVLPLEPLGDGSQRALVRDALGRALDDDVESVPERVAAGRHHAVRVRAEVALLALAPAGCEVQRAVEPGPDQRGGVRSTVGTHGREPEDLGGLERLVDLGPTRRRRTRAAEGRVELARRVLEHASPPLLSAIGPKGVGKLIESVVELHGQAEDREQTDVDEVRDAGDAAADDVDQVHVERLVLTVRSGRPVDREPRRPVAAYR